MTIPFGKSILDCEIDATMKYRVEEHFLAFEEQDRSKPTILCQTLGKLSGEAELFEKLLNSYPLTLHTFEDAGGYLSIIDGYYRCYGKYLRYLFIIH